MISDLWKQFIYVTVFVIGIVLFTQTYILDSLESQNIIKNAHFNIEEEKIFQQHDDARKTVHQNVQQVIDVENDVEATITLNRAVNDNIYNNTDRKVKTVNTVTNTEHQTPVPYRNGSALTKAPSHKPPRPIVLWTSWRSGSTFLGDLLANAVPNTFYSFEPLFYRGYQVFSDPESSVTQDVIDLTRDLLTCDLRNQSEFVKENARLKFTLAANPFYRKGCGWGEMCEDPLVFTDICMSADLHVAKIVRLSLQFAEELLQNPELSALQIVYVVRDPRAVMNSRALSVNIPWCQPTSPHCLRPADLCALAEQDLSSIPHLLQQYPHRFFLLRYEDLSLDSSSVIKDLWKKLNLPLSTTFLEYLNNTTNGNKPKGQLIDSTRDTFKHTFQWRDQIKWSLVDEVQTVCAGLIRAMGWREFSKESDLRNASYSINIIE